jgi:RNA-binding protein
MSLSADKKKAFRTIGHNLKPLVTVAGKGLSDNVIAEMDRAITDHELIKIKFAVGDRDLKKQRVQDVLEKLNMELVQQIGGIALVFRKNPQPDPHLSNLMRP